MSKTYSAKELILIGKAKKLFNDGYSILEVSRALRLPMDTTKSYKELIDKADENRKKMSKGNES